MLGEQGCKGSGKEHAAQAAHRQPIKKGEHRRGEQPVQNGKTQEKRQLEEREGGIVCKTIRKVGYPALPPLLPIEQAVISFQNKYI